MKSMMLDMMKMVDPHVIVNVEDPQLNSINNTPGVEESYYDFAKHTNDE